MNLQSPNKFKNKSYFDLLWVQETKVVFRGLRKLWMTDLGFGKFHTSSRGGTGLVDWISQPLSKGAGRFFTRFPEVALG